MAHNDDHRPQCRLPASDSDGGWLLILMVHIYDMHAQVYHAVDACVY